MLPFQPPLPTAWNLPFQPDAGSHSSILMSDSLVGVSVAATRQNAGRSANGLAPPRPPGWVKAPAPTGWAIVTAPLLSLAVARLSHVAAAAARPSNISSAAHAAVTTRAERFVCECISYLVRYRAAGPTTFGNHEDTKRSKLTKRKSRRESLRALRSLRVLRGSPLFH